MCLSASEIKSAAAKEQNYNDDDEKSVVVHDSVMLPEHDYTCGDGRSVCHWQNVSAAVTYVRDMRGFQRDSSSNWRQPFSVVDKPEGSSFLLLREEAWPHLRTAC